MVKELKVGEKIYPIKISYYALSRLQMETGMTPDDLKNNMKLLEPLFYYSIEAGCKEIGQTFDLKREDVPFILDDVYLEFIGIFKHFFPEVADAVAKKKMS